MNRRTFLIQSAGAPFLASAINASITHLKLSQLTSSTSSLAKFTFEQALRKIKEMGFGGVEILTFAGARHSIGLLPGVVVSELSSQEKPVLRELVGRFEHVTTHVPFRDISPVDKDPKIRESSRAAIRRSIMDSAFWGARVANMHVPAEQDYASCWKDMVDVYRSFGDLAAKNNLRIAIEIINPPTVSQYLQLIRDIDHEHVGGGVDTGHVKFYRADTKVGTSDLGTPEASRIYNDVLMQLVEGLGKKLIHFHVDDVRATDWREHRKLGSGIVDWNRLLRYCDQISYSGVFAIELEESAVIESLAESRRFFADRLASL